MNEPMDRVTVSLPSTDAQASDPRPTLDVRRIREDFPILRRLVRGKPLVYLDSAATTQKPEAVLAAMDHYYRQSNANVHRGVHTLAEEATALYEGARRKVAAFIGAPDPAELIFTRGTTEAINLVAASWGASLRPGDVIAVTEMEHHANLVPWQLAAAKAGAEIRAIPITDGGLLDLDALDRVVDDRCRMLAFTLVSNVLGTRNPVAPLVAAARRVGARVLVDAAQAAPQLALDVSALDVDFLTFSSHKMGGPTGIGALWGRRALLEAMPPYQGGGEMIRQVTIQASTWAELPQKFEAGTPAIAEAAGWGAAVDYLVGLGMDAVARHEEDVTAYALERLQAVPGLTIHGPLVDRGGAISFSLAGAHPHDIATILDTRGIAVRAGHHCAQPLHARLGVPASTRASVWVYTLREEIDALAEGLVAVGRVLSG
jgi:cysteine desulfurase/selenocysteine lyase